ncbi:transcriptional regulator GutM [Oceanivirga salmonicida]|uniref:transcriptional regulator GutM n=1 Tax=Oceanivirga salmonicida TaxID=1769291 RepID=UPI00083627FD|nr:transcriptional regulator GutM [Oceanivirga salmonicida]
MNIITIIILLLISFILQYIFTFMQIKNFNIFYSKLRKNGKVAIGKKKGGFRAGAIVMFSLNSNNEILDGAYMQGVTVLARFKKIDIFNGTKIICITKEMCLNKKLSLSLTEAILDSVETFKKVNCGEEIPLPKSLFGKIIEKIK